MSEGYKDQFKKYLEDHEGEAINPEVVQAGQKDLETAKKGDYTINKFSENNPKDRRMTEITHEPVAKTQNDNKMENKKLLDLYQTIDELKESLEVLGKFLLRDEVRKVDEIGGLSLKTISELKSVDGFEGITKALEIFEKYKIDFNTEIQSVDNILREKIKEAERMIEQSRQ